MIPDGLAFSSPHRLWLLAGAAGLAAAYVVVQIRRRRLAARFAEPAMLPLLAPTSRHRATNAVRHALAIVFVGAVVAASLGAAQPTLPGTEERETATVIVAIDVSDSMGATDVRPTRIAAAVRAARDFVADLPSGFDVGLVTAGSTPAVMVAPTKAHGDVLDALERLRLSPGTALGDAIFTSLAALPKVTAAERASGQPRAARIVLLSDGVTTTGRPDREAIAAAKEAGVPVSTIAFGTDDATVRSAGQMVEVPVDTSALEAIAKGTDGTFFEAATAGELRSIYDEVDAEITVVEGERDVAEWFAGAAVVLLLVAVATSLVTTSRAVWA
ncbi:MAG TPA: VWA domain-containing protein [Acidimicrobiales bacterium]|nr:VWA domain-containing protein [Acidimicrobiales bacterium]